MGNAADSLRRRVAEAIFDHGALAKVCEKTGYSRNAVKAWAAERSNPRLDAIEEIAGALGLQPWQLLKPEDASIPEAIREIRRILDGINEAEARLLLPNVQTLLESFRRTIKEMDKNKKIRDR